MDPAARVTAGSLEAQRRRALAVANGEVVPLDGITMAFTNLADESLNGGIVHAMPADAARALAAAGAAAAARGQPLGLEVERGRFPALEEALAPAGLTRLFSHPAMTAEPRRLRQAPAPADLRVSEVTDADDLAAMVRVETEAFGTALEVARGLLSIGMVRDPRTRAFVGTVDGEPVAQAIATFHAGAVGIFGVGVRSSVRGRGIGSAMTEVAASAFPGSDLAWLHPTDRARPMYERLGFREVAMWDVWTRPMNGTSPLRP